VRPTNARSLFSFLLCMSLTITMLPMGVSASGASETFIHEDAEEATYALWDAQWERYDANKANLSTDSDYWCRTMHEVHGGTHAVYCAKIGYNSHYTRSGAQCLNTNITANTSSDQSNWVMRYDTEQDSIMRKTLDPNVRYYGTLTMTFWFYSDTGPSNAVQPGSGTSVGYDFLNAIYYTGTQAAGNLTKHVLWTDSYAEATAKSWIQKTVTVPTDATMVGFEFVSGSIAPSNGDANDAFASDGITVVNGGMREGVFLDDITVVGSDPLPTLPLASEVSDLPTYENNRTFPVSYTHNDPQVGLKWITLWYRVDEAGSWTKYTTSLRPDGKFVSSPIEFVAPSDGKYEFYTRATDQLDVVEDAPSSADAWTIVDSIAPSSNISVNGIESGGSYTGHVTINLTATDATSGLGALTYRLDGGSWTTYTGNITVLTNGQHTLEYYATDVAGNNESVKSKVLTLSDASTSIVFSDSGRTYPDGNVTVTFALPFEASTITKLEYSLDGGSYVTIDSAATSVTFSGLSNGTHHLTVRATDSSGQIATGTTSFNVAYATETDMLGDIMGNPLILVGMIAAAVVAMAGALVLFKRKK